MNRHHRSTWLLMAVLSIAALSGCNHRESAEAPAGSSHPELARTTEPTPAQTARESQPTPASLYEPKESPKPAESGVDTSDLKPAERTPDVVFVPTPQNVVDRMLELVKVQRGETVYDLGCGDGRIVVTAAKKYGAVGRGFDIDPKRVVEARKNVADNGVGSLVQISQRDVFTLDLSEADVITLYLLPELNVKLIPQLDKLRPGVRIVSHDFDMAGVKPDHFEEIGEHSIYVFSTPLKKIKK